MRPRASSRRRFDTRRLRSTRASQPEVRSWSLGGVHQRRGEGLLGQVVGLMDVAADELTRQGTRPAGVLEQGFDVGRGGF